MLYPRENKCREIKEIGGLWSVRLDRDGQGRRDRWFEGAFDNEYFVPSCTSINELVTSSEDRDFAGDFWYRQKFYLPAGWNDRRITLRFGGVTFNCDVWINGDHIGANKIVLALSINF